MGDTGQSIYRARKGDVCAIEQRHSSYSKPRSTWYVGRVESASRAGVIKTASADLPTESGKPFPMAFREYDRDATVGWRTLTISNPIMRVAATNLIGREFASSD